MARIVEDHVFIHLLDTQTYPDALNEDAAGQLLAWCTPT